MKRGKLWNNNRMSSSLMVMKKNLKKKKKKMSSNSYNNRLSGSSSSPILKRHKKMGDGKVRTTISDLPEEVLTKVLVRVSSVKDVLSCVCVKKSWFFLIKTRKFITLHSNHHQISSSRNNKYLLFWDHKAKSYEIRVDDIGCKKYLKPKYPPQLSKLYLRCRLVSSNGGLICLFTLRVTTNPLDIYLWNPVIQKYISLPHSPHPPTKTWEKAIAFGFVPQTNDYLVVYMIKYTHSIFITCVYSLNTNSWTKITHRKTHIQNISQSGGIFVNGIAIWTAYNLHNHRILVCFDTKTHMLREILSPKTPGKLGGSLPLICAFDDDQSVVYFVEKGTFLNEHDMWILKGDPMTEFVWEKKMMIRPKKAFARVLGLRNNGDPILRNAFNLISYDLDTHKSYHFASSWNNWTTFHFGDNRHPRAAFFFLEGTSNPKTFYDSTFCREFGFACLILLIPQHILPEAALMDLVDYY